MNTQGYVFHRQALHHVLSGVLQDQFDQNDVVDTQLLHHFPNQFEQPYAQHEFRSHAKYLLILALYEPYSHVV